MHVSGPPWIATLPIDPVPRPVRFYFGLWRDGAIQAADSSAEGSLCVEATVARAGAEPAADVKGAGLAEKAAGAASADSGRGGLRVDWKAAGLSGGSAGLVPVAGPGQGGGFPLVTLLRLAAGQVRWTVRGRGVCGWRGAMDCRRRGRNRGGECITEANALRWPFGGECWWPGAGA